jgi:hypothetical protein
MPALRGLCASRLGCPSDTHPDTLVVTDVFPLPVTGFETRVVADDESVINYMIELSEMIERTRKERIMGWYHSHPFDVDEAHNHCFLSSTDMSTQLAWQNAEDGAETPHERTPPVDRLCRQRQPVPRHRHRPSPVLCEEP